LKNKLAIILVTLLLLTGAESQAVVFGIRFSNTQEQPLRVLIDKGISDSGAKGRFGLYAGTLQGNSYFMIGADYDRFKMERGDSLLYSRRLTIDVGYRYQLLSADKANAMNFMPFLALHLFKSFSKVQADSGTLRPVDVTYYKDLSNDEGGWISVGGEYFFAPVFSLGAEGGLRYTRANTKAYGYDIKIRQYNTFVALLLSFYL
jgi:hypothetical protein